MADSEHYHIESDSMTGAVRQLVEQIRAQDPMLGGAKLRLHCGAYVTIDLNGPPMKLAKREIGRSTLETRHNTEEPEKREPETLKEVALRLGTEGMASAGGIVFATGCRRHAATSAIRELFKAGKLRRVGLGTYETVGGADG